MLKEVGHSYGVTDFGMELYAKQRLSTVLDDFGVAWRGAQQLELRAERNHAKGMVLMDSYDAA